MALFGTDGVRGVAGVDLTEKLALDLAVAAAEVLTESGEFAGHRPVAIVGQDSRESGAYLEAAICKGLTESGVDVRRVGILPTPAVSFLITELKADLGVMISASHNPARDNGIKFFARTGRKLDDALEAKIESLLGQPWQRPADMEVGRAFDDKEAREKYISYLLSTIHTRFDGLKVVVDCANGAASYVAPEVLRRAGAEVIAISASPNGLNINENCGSGILADHTDLPTKTVVGTVMTNLGLIRALEKRGVGFIATPVGDRYVLEKMLAEGHTLGGEQSGHIIMQKYANTGDGLLTALHLISHLAQSKKTLKELAAFMVRYPQVLINVSGVSKEKLAHNLKIQESVAEIEKSLGASGRVLLRASGTEPLIRVMIEAENGSDAQQFAESLASLVKSELSL